jgi:hypothetical protein
MIEKLVEQNLGTELHKQTFMNVQNNMKTFASHMNDHY